MERVQICEARTQSEFLEARGLIEEYAAALEVDLCFQNFAYELAHLHEMYGPPRGCLLMARQDGALAGCVCIRSFGSDACEMKRLYVRPVARGLKLGRRLAVAAIDKARELGYERMVLDTLPSMETAQALYRSLGFRNRPPHQTAPVEDVTYLELALSSG
ncbi:MAG TPA: GNAT family N-acetyltransferase [Vicinamibacterales bacterium]|jgi:ribosomal protein S18 acetylase RimI-like enzyme